MNWSAEQRRLLGAMGYQLMVSTTAGPAAAAVDSAGAAPAPIRAAAAAAQFPELERALRRAAGDRDISALIEDLGRLRGTPTLKRALWPRLRALRRSH